MISSNDLRAAHAATRDAAVGHRFVDELWDGTVDDAVMARYLARDALFLDSFVALLDTGVGFLRDEADRVGPDGAAFAHAVELETAFFDAAYG